MMRLFKPVGTALRALRRNVMRAVLTMLGIVIGVGAVIAMTEIGQGSSAAMQKTIATMGANNVLLFPGSARSQGVSSGAGTTMTMTPDDAEAIARECPAVRHVAPIVGARAQVVYGNRNYVPVYILGVTPAYLEVRYWTTLAEGDPFDDGDVRRGTKVCLLGQTVARELFDDESPVGKEIRIRDVSFTVVGVLEAKGANTEGQDQDDLLLAPWTTIKYRVSSSPMRSAAQSSSVSSSSGQGSRYPGNRGSQRPVRFTTVDAIQASAWSGEEVPVAISQITKLLRERHRLRYDQEDDFRVLDLTELTKVRLSFSEQMRSLLLAVAAISLVVGGVGIMNIMLVSVTERTREIGLRMAVGARSRDILRQFLVEAVVLCLIGGGIGIAVGRAASLLVTYIKRWPTEPSIEAVVASVAVSAFVGIVFGFYPAWKASRLDPIEALRYE